MEYRQVSDIWESSDPYEKYVGRWSRRVAPIFLSWLHVPAGKKWLDVGFGTGALSEAIVDHCSPALVVGVEPAEGFVAEVKTNYARQVTLLRGTATEIPLNKLSVDVVVSGLVLNFIQDKCAALAEMVRVTRNGGTVGAYVWDYAEMMQIIRLFWDSAVELDPEAVKMDEGIRFPECSPDAQTKLFISAGLDFVEVRAIDIPTKFASFEEY